METDKNLLDLTKKEFNKIFGAFGNYASLIACAHEVQTKTTEKENEKK